MAEIFRSVQLDSHCTLSLTPLTDRQIAASGQEVDDPSGYFLVETRTNSAHSEVEIIARVMSDEAAVRLADLFRMR